MKKRQRFVTLFFFPPFLANCSFILFSEEYDKNYSMTFSYPESIIFLNKYIFRFKRNDYYGLTIEALEKSLRRKHWLSQTKLLLDLYK